MNRKEGIIVGVLLLSTFMGSTVAAPAIQQMLIVNDPLNVRIVGGTPTQQTTGVDIEIVSFGGVEVPPGVNNGLPAAGILVTSSSQPGGTRLTAGFSFAPIRGFVQVNSVMVTITYQAQSPQTGDSFSVRLNGLATTNIPLLPATNPNIYLPLIATVTLGSQDLHVGANVIGIGAIPAMEPNNTGMYFVYEVRLTVEYAFIS